MLGLSWWGEGWLGIGDFEPLGCHDGMRDDWGFRTPGLSWWGEV